MHTSQSPFCDCGSVSALTPAGVLVGAVLSKKSVNSFFSAFFYLPSLVICESLHPDHLIESLPTTTSLRKKKKKKRYSAANSNLFPKGMTGKAIPRFPETGTGLQD